MIIEEVPSTSLGRAGQGNYLIWSNGAASDVGWNLCGEQREHLDRGLTVIQLPATKPENKKHLTDYRPKCKPHLLSLDFL